MRQKPIEFKDFNLGGIADSDYIGYKNSMASLVGLDIHSQPGLVKPNHKFVKISGTTVDGRIIRSFAATDGNTYLFSYDSGKIWKLNGSTVTLVYTTVATNGESKCLGAYEYRGYIYWATQNWLHRIPISKTSDWNANAEPNWKQFTKDDVFLDIPPLAGIMDGVDDYFQALTNDDLAFSNDNVFTFSAWVKLNESSMEKRNVLWGTKKSITTEFQIELGRFSDLAKGIRVLKGSTTVALTGEQQELQYRTQNGMIGSTPDQVGSGGSLKEQTENTLWNSRRLLAGSNPNFSKIFDGEKWVHIVYRRTATGDNHSIFVNGVEQVLVSSTADDFVDGNSDKYIGASHDNTEFEEEAFFDGAIVNVQFFDAALTDQEILDLYTYNSYEDSEELASYLKNSADTTPTNGAYFDYDYDWERYHMRGEELANALDEEPGSKKYFYTTQSPIKYIDIHVANVGTGNWTITIHDDEDNELATETILNASITKGLNQFTIDGFDPDPGTRYHLHIFTSTGDGALIARTRDKVRDSQIEIYGEGDSEFHPMIEQNRDLYIGDRNNLHKVAQINGLHGLILNALDLPKPHKIISLGLFETSVVVGTKQADTVTGAKVYRWDTYSVSFNNSDGIDEIGINAFIHADNLLFVNPGYGGDLAFYNGAKLQKIKKIKGEYSPSKTAKIWPDASTFYKGLPMFGFSNVSGNPALQGVYSYGAINESYPRVLNLEYPIKADEENELILSDLIITSLTVHEGKLCASWYDGANDEYGVSVLSSTDYIDKAYCETRILGAEDRDNTKYFGSVKAAYADLPEEGEDTADIKLYAKLNHGDYTELTTANDTIRKLVQAEETKEGVTCQLKLELINKSATEPPVLEAIILRMRGQT